MVVYRKGHKLDLCAIDHSKQAAQGWRKSLVHQDRTLRELFAESLRDKNINTRPFATPAAPAQEKYNQSFQWEIYGTTMGPYITPTEYTAWWDESIALRSSAMLGDWSFLAKYRIAGPDARRFVDYACTKDMTRQKLNQIYFTPMVDQEGRVAMEGLFFRLGEDEYIFTDGPPIEWFKQLQTIKEFDVSIDDVTPDYSVYQLQGPRCFDVLESMTRQNFHDLKFSRGRWIKYRDYDVYISRQGVTGELGFEIMAPVDGKKAPIAVLLWDALAEAGKDFDLRMVGNKARRIGHVEAGIPTRRFDYTRAIPSGDMAADRFDREKFAAGKKVSALDTASQYATPAELGWDYLVDLDRDFYGREALKKEKEFGGPSRKMTGLIWNSDDVISLFAGLFGVADRPLPPSLPRQSQPLWLRIMEGSEFIGWATSPTYSPTLRRLISFGRMNRQLCEPGEEVRLEYCDHRGATTIIRAAVTDLPFIPHQRSKDMSKEKSILEP